jgi:hypothetical protein
MATEQNTPQNVRRTLTHEDIKQLGQFVAAKATPKMCKDPAAREKLLTIVALLSVLAFEHPQGLGLDLTVKTSAKGGH